MAAEHIIIISDLHISAAQLDDFDSELEQHLICFLESFLAERPYPIELVINGDFLDFVQAPPFSGGGLQGQSKERVPLCFTQPQSRAKLKAIYNHHRPTFSALHKFLASKIENSLLILPGNHDADFFWPGVREDFIQLVSDGDVLIGNRIRFHLERSYRPSTCPEVWIEHGQQYDPINAFAISEYPYWSEKNPPILSDGEEDRLYACLGTRFLIDYLNNLDADYPFVDNVKPFSRFVRLFLVSTALIPFKAAVAGWRIAEYLAKMTVTHPKDLLGVEKIENNGKQTLLDRLRGMAQRNDMFYRRINEAYPGQRDLRLLLNDPTEQPGVLEWLSENLDLLQEPERQFHGNLLGLDDGDGSYLSLAKGFRLDETALLVDAADKLLNSDNRCGIKLVIMGHTHEAVANPKGLRYYNTGSWTRYYRFGKDDHPSAWSILKERSYANFPYQLNYMDVKVNCASEAEMICFKSKDHD